ncbi:MAG: GNAT family N-acetyltransferase [Bacilli bacterium]|nr:GNAT family N-acetyltransferase [Bacilli bacterium]
MISIRRAKIDDARDYATILNTSWKDTYGSYISHEQIDKEFNIDNLIKGFEEHLNASNFELYMIEYDQRVIGIVELGKPDIDDIYKDDMDGIGELRSFYIMKEYHNLGIGTKVEDMACKRLKELGYKICCIWVKKQNYNAIKFYEKRGFIKTQYTCEETSDGAPSFVMEKNLESEK